jgi:hypothetical protein
MEFTPMDELADHVEEDWSKPSKAVVANMGVGCALWTIGPHVQSMIDNLGHALQDLGLDDAPDGISVWEGVLKTVHIVLPDANEDESWLEGSFREPTEEEWSFIKQNRCPWEHS